MKSNEFVEKVKSVATDFKTLYIMGCFGAPMNERNKKGYSSNYAYNKKAERTQMIQNASADTFGFDCVCLIKGILWGWKGDVSLVYGGAEYRSNNVPDIGANAIIDVCNNTSTDFSNIIPGELVWMKGHVGIYIGDGLAVECSPAWKNGVQITACNQSIKGYNRRNWTKHGRLPYIEYEEKEVEEMLYNIQITKNLGKGMTGDEVKKLQIRVAQISPEYESEMKSHSFSNGQFDGSFGPSMVKTIKKLQEEAGLTVTGSVDEATRELLNGNILTLSKKISDVKKILE